MANDPEFRMMIKIFEYREGVDGVNEIPTENDVPARATVAMLSTQHVIIIYLDTTYSSSVFRSSLMRSFNFSACFSAFVTRILKTPCNPLGFAFEHGVKIKFLGKSSY